jgi:hypothetical protein
MAPSIRTLLWIRRLQWREMPRGYTVTHDKTFFHAFYAMAYAASGDLSFSFFYRFLRIGLLPP